MIRTQKFLNSFNKLPKENKLEAINCINTCCIKEKTELDYLMNIVIEENIEALRKLGK